MKSSEHACMRLRLRSWHISNRVPLPLPPLIRRRLHASLPFLGMLRTLRQVLRPQRGPPRHQQPLPTYIEQRQHIPVRRAFPPLKKIPRRFLRSSRLLYHSRRTICHPATVYRSRGWTTQSPRSPTPRPPSSMTLYPTAIFLSYPLKSATRCDKIKPCQVATKTRSRLDDQPPRKVDIAIAPSSTLRTGRRHTPRSPPVIPRSNPALSFQSPTSLRPQPLLATPIIFPCISSPVQLLFLST